MQRGYKKPDFFLTHTKGKKERKEEAEDVWQMVVLA